jgi:hypothetical protein
MRKYLMFLTVLPLMGPLAIADDDHDHDHDDDHGHHHHHGGDLMLGVDTSGKLGIEYDFDEAIELPPTSGLLSGWAGDDPGLFGLEENEDDFFMLSQDARIAMEIVSIDAGLRFWDVGFVEKTAGDLVTLTTFEADENLWETHYHPGAWHLDPDAGADPGAGSTYSLSFRLIDQGTSAYAPSDLYALTFVPEPTSAVLLAAGVVALLRRRSL